MTLRYVEVVQLDLQREFHRARQKRPPFTPSPNSHFPRLQPPRESTSLPFAKTSPQPTTSSNCSSPSWKIRLAASFADSPSGS